MRYCFDIDGVIATKTARPGDYFSAKPVPHVADRIRRLYDQGHHIILFTARGSTTGLDWRKVTEQQMQEWDVPYHELLFGKPEADLYIDDRGVNVSEWAEARTPFAAALRDMRALAQAMVGMEGLIERAGRLIRECLDNGGKVLICGNGGSAASAQHFAAELVGHMRGERRPLPAIALSSDPSIVTAIANDYGYENVFARQVWAYGRKGNVVIGISTSGKSLNVLRSLKTARVMGMHTIGLSGGDMMPSDIPLAVPSSDTQRVQEMHDLILHVLAEYMEPEQDGTRVEVTALGNTKRKFINVLAKTGLEAL